MCCTQTDPASSLASSYSVLRYQRREPERPLRHRILRENLATILAEAAARYLSGDLPAFIAEEFSRYVRCGILSHGFARVRCPSCRDESLVAFSCKNRGVRPSCCARRLADTAAHLRGRGQWIGRALGRSLGLLPSWPAVSPNAQRAKV